ncbi:MAG TPA: LL-diaminopimelate aminotransferase [Candidatus Limnocylindria bacterium]
MEDTIGMGSSNVVRAQRLAKLPPYLYVEIRKRVREAQARGVDVISLGVGDPDQPTPQHVIDALARAAADPANHQYPTGEQKGMPAFRKAVAGWYERRFGVRLDPDSEVLALIGSKEGNHHLALALLDPGDMAIVPDPGYPAYVASAIFAGAEVVRVPLRHENGFVLDFADVPAEVARRAKVIWLSYPNNPTTAVAPLEFWQRAVDWARANDVLLVSDNPYSEISFDGLRVPSVLEAHGARDVAIEFNSLSKPYNMTGWRVGMAVGNADLIAAIDQVKENTDSGIFNAVQYAGIAALEGPQDIVSRNIEIYKRRRDLAVSTLRSIGLAVEPPKATFYVWAPVPAGITSIDFAARLLELTGVVVTPGIGYGSRGEGFVRMSLSVPDARLEEAMGRIRRVRDELGAQLAASR